MNQRKIRSLRGRLARLARNACANYKPGGDCNYTACKLCVLQLETETAVGNVCPYFMKAVLPVDPTLERDYLKHFPDDYPLKKKLSAMKKCDRCREPIEADSPNRKYCSDCKALAERDSKRRRMQRYRV